MDQLLTLDTIEQDFSQWRQRRKSRTEPIPQALWDKITSIKDYYKHSEICKRLNLSGSQFKDRTQPNTTKVLDFVTVMQEPQDQTATLSLKSQTRTLEIAIPIAHLGDVLPKIGQLL